MKRLGETVASAISSNRVNERTRLLLEQTQQQAEEMKSQEEEMRQNMEEMQATQEGTQRMVKELEGKESYTNELLNASTDLIYTVDKKYCVISWNKLFAVELARFGMHLQKGMNSLDWFPDEAAKKNQIVLFDRVLLKGETFNVISASEINGATYHFQNTYTPLRNAQNQIVEVIVYARDVTEQTVAQKNIEKMLADSQQQTEELKAQEEELRQNMEELHAIQENAERNMIELRRKESYLQSLINATHDPILTIDKNYSLVYCNEAVKAMFKGTGVDLKPGISILELIPASERENSKINYDKALSGESFTRESDRQVGNVRKHFVVSYNPLHNEDGSVQGVAIFTKSVGDPK